MKRIFMVFIILLSFSSMAQTQEQYGNIRGVVLDEHGDPLPGVTVTLESELYNPRTILTSQGGIFRFLNISVGLYRVKCELSGFKTYIQQNIDVRIGFNLDLNIAMEPASLEEQVTVMADSPFIDMKKTGTATQFTQEMLQEIPSARDPWVILQQTPGILVTTENVGGSDSGLQSLFWARGSMFWNTMWNMDGVPTTDMVGLGASTMYYDFDIFEEMQIVTSGQNATNRTGGVSINFITRRGANKWQTIGRTYFTNDKLQSDNRTQEIIDLDYGGNRINQIMDYGLQVGGPIKKDKAWFWLGYGVQDIKIISIDGYPDDTKLEGINSKLNFQISRKNRAELAFIRNEKISLGREGGPTRPPETTYDQGLAGYYIKLEDEHTFSSNFLLSLKLAHQWGPWWLEPKGGMDVQPGWDYATGIWSGSRDFYRQDYRNFVLQLDGNYFIEDFLGGDHEIKFGAGYRLVPATEEWDWAGNAIKYYWEGIPIEAEVTREGFWDYQCSIYSLYLNDIFTKGRFTLSLGLRLDRERSWNNDATVKASKVAPELLPSLTYPGVDPDVTFLDFSPRIGFTYDLTGDGKTILRGNVARYAGQWGTWNAYWVSSSYLASAIYEWNDPNGDDLVTTDELIGYPTEGILWWYGFDPWDPTNLDSPNAVDKNLKTDLTDELILGFERELFSDLSLSLNLILRRNSRIDWYPYYDKETGKKLIQEDYIGPISGTIEYGGKAYDYEYWTLSEYRPAGEIMESHPDYYHFYRGIEISAVKRLSHRWMLSASFTYQLHTEHYGEDAISDPTNIDKIDGARFYMKDTDWMAKVSFLYQLPWRFNISGFANARQGYIIPQYIRIPTPERGDVGLGGYTNIFIEKWDANRLPVFYNVDLSLTKDISLDKYGMLTLCVDAFNIFNYAHDLDRFRQVNSSRHDEIQQILNPRVIRFGVRYRF